MDIGEFVKDGAGDFRERACEGGDKGARASPEEFSGYEAEEQSRDGNHDSATGAMGSRLKLRFDNEGFRRSRKMGSKRYVACSNGSQTQ
jgi:hypothetical protein